ncbi:TetR family transcriptional regulator [Agromyces badenianii]|uniref:TetR family transcriptional regulator n=1 Tax=Agromyces badenianii TaxID=2080742 RepID=A0A2S0WZ70_9MICO|nr:TetR/AcrR family transcriptional regulator [Agromyces badenianii]AWB96572.1 TetR family transcriptional regulator [Agromyces badenianii]PWC05489.1 TetR/AcrR family transcriptional regulator [Agromyces badenianii]
MSSMSVEDVAHAPRMRSADRRELILTAATAVFGAKTYVGTTTDEIARAAGVSQPYVVRLFGTKEKLFVEVIERAYRRLLAEFRAALPGPVESRAERMGTAYTGLLAERGMLPVIANSTALGGEPVIGQAARTGFSEIWRFVREEAGFSKEEAREFMATGMLINTIVGLRLIGEYGDELSATEMFDACFADGVAKLRALMPTVDAPW